MPQHDQDDKPTHSIDDARQGQVVLRSKLSRKIFIGGLIAMVVLPLVLALLTR